MIADTQYAIDDRTGRFVEHEYGDNIFIIQSPSLMRFLEKISVSSGAHPLLNSYIEFIYQKLFFEMMDLVPNLSLNKVVTRMEQYHGEKGTYSYSGFDLNQKFVTVNLARAGTFPSHICFNLLNYLVAPQNVRQDHFVMSRKTDANGKVIGTDMTGTKLAGPIEDSIILLPDPMGATGGTICETISFYKKEAQGKKLRFVALHMIVTPEYLKRVSQEHPDVVIIAGRLDRGFSSDKALQSKPGTYAEEEKGLDTTQYIVPGAGGIGELLNNALY